MTTDSRRSGAVAPSGATRADALPEPQDASRPSVTPPIAERAGTTVLVCGGRAFDDHRCVFRTLDVLHAKRRIALIVHGDATGADRWADRWAHTGGNDIGRMAFPADWERHGRAAGPIRNAEMLRAAKPDVVVAFPGGKGTADMVRRAKAAGVDVIEVA